MNVLDTYALMEISKGNEEYLNLKKYPFYIPETTIAEFYGVVIREHNKQTADYWLKKLGPFIFRLCWLLFCPRKQSNIRHRR